MRVVHPLAVGVWLGNLSLLALLTGVIASCASPVPPPDYKLNPHPEKYLVTIHSDKPLPSGLRVRVQYSLKQSKCIPPDHTRALGGVRLSYTQHFFPAVKYSFTNTASALVSAEKILPGDYWGRGTCRWAFVAVVVIFPGNYSIYMEGHVVKSSGRSVWSCYPVDLPDRTNLCAFIRSTDATGSILEQGVTQGMDQANSLITMTARRSRK